MSEFHYALGLDIGIGSVGWAVLRNQPNGEPDRIQDLGVRIFDKAEQPKTGASLAAPRRDARSARRRLRRHRHRLERIRYLVEQRGMMSVSDMGISEDSITLVAPELKILRNLQMDKNFEIDSNLFVIGAVTGKFRGILQSFCSGTRCGQLLDRG